MQSIRQLYRVGIGPSSSHTMGPVYAVENFLTQYYNCASYKVVLQGSLAKTGKGHGTDIAILNAFPQDANVQLVWDTTTVTKHPNTMHIYGYKGDKEIVHWTVESVGGGEIVINGHLENKVDIYPHSTFQQIKQHCLSHNIQLWQYVERVEGKLIYEYMQYIWDVMNSCIDIGLETVGTLGGGLGVLRRANKLSQPIKGESSQQRDNRIVASYAFAVGEQNASQGVVVTTPTCGASGVLPAAFRYYQELYNLDNDTIYKGLLTAGLVGNLIKTNASISGAQCGCQAEIGSACCMTAAGLSAMMGYDIDVIECSAEIALEHHLGLTCDPVDGLVQIPCIERNAVASVRAINASNIATFLSDSRKISLDTVIDTMYETGKDLGDCYRETADGGLAKHYNKGDQ